MLLDGALDGGEVDPAPAQVDITRATGGGAGTTTAGGAGGLSVTRMSDGMLEPTSVTPAAPDGWVIEATAGAAAQGGAGASSGDGGGGGGGGVFGGGGGGAGFESSGAGGGGGASLVPAGGTASDTHVGPGVVTVAWAAGGGCGTSLPASVVTSGVVASPRYTG